MVKDRVEKILDVRNLSISFRTPAGLVKAVRGVNFSVNRGETLAIVGESGSGKSVTSRAIIGISAGNAIVESGEIIFDGQDLVKISEEDFHNIRGEKIAMIFQDPLSALNPIVKIGKQLTEAMVIKGKINQSKSRKLFNERLKLINHFMDLATNAGGNPTIKEANAKRCKDFDTFERKHVELEGAFNIAKEAIETCLSEIKDLTLEISKKVARDVPARLKEILDLAQTAINPYVVHAEADRLKEVCAMLAPLFDQSIAQSKIDNIAKFKYHFEPFDILLLGIFAYLNKRTQFLKDVADYSRLLAPLDELKAILERADALTVPDFFAIAYYLTFTGQELPKMPISDLNVHLVKHLNEQFMDDFVAHAYKAVEFSFRQSLEEKKTVLSKLEDAKEKLTSELTKEKADQVTGLLYSDVAKSINQLTLRKDSGAYTFKSSLSAELNRYFTAVKKNVSETKRYNRETAKHDALRAKGRAITWKVVPPAVVDLELVKQNIVKIIESLGLQYHQDILNAPDYDLQKLTLGNVDYLRNMAANCVKRMTKRLAKVKALKVMEEVGISDSRKRYNQYPFQFSGGMRQRIVIAIALTANPDILICDEPTTALDVTIQAQILDLINKLKVRHNLSVIFITHDLGVVANMADRIAVMYAGKVVEYGTSEEVFYSPAHPYTWALLASMPDLETKEKVDAIPGTPPNMIYPPKGDAFAARSKYAMKIDFEEQPPYFELTPTHSAATWLLHPDAPKVEMPKLVSERIDRSKVLRAKIAAKGNQVNEGGTAE